MNWKEAETILTAALAPVYNEGEAAAIAALAMEAITGAARSHRLLNGQTPLTTPQQAQWQELQQRLLQHEPVQYILQKAHFYGMDLYVNASVLIPRSETEELVQWIVDDVRERGTNVFDRRPGEADATTTLKILDVGTGSGCIALGLKKVMPKAEVWGCDVSDEALNIARRNGSQLDVRVDFQGIDFLDEAQQGLLPVVDILVSNPPYIPESDKATMQPNVLRYEPHLALFVPNNDALRFYRALALFGKKHLHHGGRIYLEIHEDLAADVVALFKGEGYGAATVKKDMQGKERMVRVSNPPS